MIPGAAHFFGFRFYCVLFLFANSFRSTARKCQWDSEEIPEINSMVDIFRAASDLPQLGFTDIRLAFVDRFADQKDLNEFGCLVAANRGMIGQISTPSRKPINGFYRKADQVERLYFLERLILNFTTSWRIVMTDNIAVKPFTINYEEYPGYLYALVHGEKYDYEILSRYLREVAEECGKRNFSRVLIEENISATASEADVFRIASELPQLGYSKIRMAFIDRFSDQDALNEFGQQIAVKSGVDVKIFGNQTDAHKWLSEDG